MPSAKKKLMKEEYEDSTASTPPVFLSIDKLKNYNAHFYVDIHQLHLEQASSHSNTKMVFIKKSNYEGTTLKSSNIVLNVLWDYVLLSTQEKKNTSTNMIKNQSSSKSRKEPIQYIRNLFQIR